MVCRLEEYTIFLRPLRFYSQPKFNWTLDLMFLLWDKALGLGPGVDSFLFSVTIMLKFESKG